MFTRPAFARQGSTVAKWICRNDWVMSRWICGTKDRDETLSASLQSKLGIEVITRVLRSQRARSYSHTQQAVSCIKSSTNFQIPALESMKCLDGRDLNIWRLMSAIVTWMAMHGEPVFSIAWWCQPHRMRHGQHLNLKLIWMETIYVTFDIYLVITIFSFYFFLNFTQILIP